MVINVDESRKIFAIQTQNTTYAFAIDNIGLVRHIYWGKKISCLEDIEVPILSEFSSNDPVLDIAQEEFPVFGGMRYKEQCLKVRFFDGTRDIAYLYEGYEISGKKLTVKLKDEYYDLKIKLNYNIIPERDLIERSTTIVNSGESNIEIEEIYSGQIHIPHQDLTLTATKGLWLAELQEFKQQVASSKMVLESRRGLASHNHNPFFILDSNADESAGDVYFGALKWSGNFKTVIEPRIYGSTLVQMGLNPYDCEFTLKPNESFTTPIMVIGYSADGFSKMSIQMHEYAKTYILKGGFRPVLYNSWEAMVFDVTCDGQIELAKKAASLGCELFVLDDGWFGNRNSDKDGLGDWHINPKSSLRASHR